MNQELLHKYGRFVAIIVLVLALLLFINRDYKEYGFYLEKNDRIEYLGDPFGGENRNVLNLQTHLAVTEEGDFDLVFYFPEFKPERLHLYASPVWKLIEDVPIAKTNELQPYHLRVTEMGKKKYAISSNDLPESNLLSMVYQPPRGAYFFSALGRDAFDTLVIDGLEQVDGSKLQKRFAKSLHNAYPEEHAFYQAAEHYEKNYERGEEYRLYQSAIHNKSDYQRRRLLKKFIQDYPRSKYRSKAETALASAETHRSRGSNVSSRSSYTPPVASQPMLESIVRRYVSGINTKDYATARSVATSRAESNVSRLERSGKILDSKNYTSFDQRQSSATLFASDGSTTTFVHKGGSWRISKH